MSSAADETTIEQYPLSPLQHGMLFHQLQSGRHTGVDIEQLEGHLHESIRQDLFRQAWDSIAARHAALRTRFRWEGLDKPRQEVVASVASPFHVIDVSSKSAAERSATFTAFLEADRRLGFDLSEAPLWRVTLFRISDADYRMVWTYSHAILDSSFAEVVREVFAVYEALIETRPPQLEDRRAYRDHILWLENDLHTRTEEIRGFWRGHLAGFTSPTNLETAQLPVARGDTVPSGHDTVNFRISRETFDRIRSVAAANDVRSSTFVDAAWALVLRSFSGQDDVVFGSTRACRRSSIAGAEAIIGLFINTVPVRARVVGDRPVLEFLRELRREQRALRPFEHTPLVDVLSCADIPRGTSLFDTIIVFNDAENDARLKSFGGSWTFGISSCTTRRTSR